MTTHRPRVELADLPSMEAEIRRRSFAFNRRPGARNNRGRVPEPSGSGGAAPIAPSAIAGYCWDLDADLGITLGSTPRAAGTSPPVWTLSGTLTLNVQFRAEITTGGALGAALFRYSADGGATWIASGVTTAASVPLTGAMSGVTVAMDPGPYATNNVYVGLVAGVTDQSPSAAHVSNAASATQPDYFVSDANFGGHNAVAHITTDAGLPVSASLGIRHIFAVAKHPLTSFATYACLLMRQTTSLVWLGDSGFANWRSDGFDIAGTYVRDGVTAMTALSTANAPHVQERVFAALQTASTWRVGDQGIAAGRQWGGRWTRMIGFNVPVTGADLAGLRAYLKQRYGTP